MGITLAGFKGVGYIPEEKERLNMSTRCVEISSFSNFNILVGILFGSEDLLSLREDVMEINSSLSVGVMKKNLNYHYEGSPCNFYLTILYLMEFFLILN